MGWFRNIRGKCKAGHDLSPLNCESYGCPLNRKISIDGKDYKVTLSEEALQDVTLFEINHRGVIRTGELEEQEIKDWQKYDQFYKDMNLDEVRQKYSICYLDKEEPYQEYCW